MHLSGRAFRLLSLAFLLSCSTFEPVAGDGGASSGSSSGASGSSGTPATDGETIAAGLSSPRSLQATSAGPYWLAVVSDGGSNAVERLHHCPPDGCKGNPALFLPQEEIRSLTADGNEIFWTNGGNDTIHACIVGATCTRTDVFKGIALGSILASNGRILFESTNAGENTLQRCERATCSTSASVIWSGNGIGVYAPTGEDVWLTTGQPSIHLQRSIGGAKPTEVGTLRGLPTSMTVSGTNVHYVSTNALDYCNAASSCSPVTVDPAAENQIWSVRRTGDAVYYVVQAQGGTPGKVMRCTNPDCTTRQAMVAGGNPRDVAVSDGWLYWIDLANERPGAASIKRVKL